ncbi:MAG: ThuA domain-containing protein [Coleofasciculus sp. C1-SOL-03]|uniref:ThuA domain-containing protein n=1 Tax=Coleofasciculus sp. C1-SOL-03 TaxID=3069522 RepID=UPI0032FF0911
MTANPRVTVWNEYQVEKQKPEVAQIYPDGIHHAIAQHLQSSGLTVKTATLDQPDHGLTDAILNQTDVLIWWGHIAHDQVQDAIVDKVHQRVLSGMGLIVLHSGHFSKIFKRLMGTSCSLKWRNDGEKERLWLVDPSHPIAAGLDESFELAAEEMYGEFFDIPNPDSLVFISWFEGGEVFRSGCCFHRGKGKIFYFRPGDELYPTYYQPNVLRVITNSVYWASPLN